MNRCVFALALLAAAVVVRAEVDPVYTSWSQYGLGTTVKSRNLTEAGGSTSDVTLVTTLVEKSADKVVVELIMLGPDGKPALQPIRQDIKAQAQPQRGQGRGPKEDRHESQESITVSGRQYDAKVVETANKGSTQTVTRKVWTSAEFPGLTIKSVMTMDGSVKSTTTVEAVEVTIK